MRDILARLLRDPLGTVRRGWEKLVVAPRRYRQGDGYDAAGYWGDRFRRYGTSLRGAGDEGLTEDENLEVYAVAAQVVTAAIADAGVRPEEARVLEIGPGTGFYTGLLHDLGVRSYVAQDVTDVLFAEHRARFPGFEFVRRDVTEGRVEGAFDLVVMIDVLEHIVEDERLDRALANAAAALAPGGVFLLGPVAPTSRRHTFYVRLWSLADIRSRLPGFELETRPFRTGELATIRRAQDTR